MNISAAGLGRVQSSDRNRNSAEVDPFATDNRVFQRTGEHGNVAPLDGGGQSAYDACRATHRVHPSVHQQLHFVMRGYQGSLSAEPIGSIGMCVSAKFDSQSDY